VNNLALQWYVEIIVSDDYTKHRVLHYLPVEVACIINTYAILNNICIANNLPLVNIDKREDIDFGIINDEL